MYSSVSAANRAQPPGRQPAGGECPSREHKLSLCFALPPLGPRAGSLSLSLPPPPAALPTHSQRFAYSLRPLGPGARVRAWGRVRCPLLTCCSPLPMCIELVIYLYIFAMFLFCYGAYCATVLLRWAGAIQAARHQARKFHTAGIGPDMAHDQPSRLQIPSGSTH
jgi:hypothetical protein